MSGMQDRALGYRDCHTVDGMEKRAFTFDEAMDAVASAAYPLKAYVCPEHGWHLASNPNNRRPRL